MRCKLLLLLLAILLACEDAQKSLPGSKTTETADTGSGITLDSEASSRLEVTSDSDTLVDIDAWVSDSSMFDVVLLDSSAREWEIVPADSRGTDAGVDDGGALDVSGDPGSDGGLVRLDSIASDIRNVEGSDVVPSTDDGVDTNNLDIGFDLIEFDGIDLIGDVPDGPVVTDAGDALVTPADVEVSDILHDATESDSEPTVRLGQPCDDGSRCTDDDTIQVDHSCAGVVTACDDSEPCTQDICWPNVGCKHVWVPGCGGKNCGECPTEFGFSCIEEPTGAACVSADGRRVYVPAGIFRFGEKDSWNVPWDGSSSVPTSKPLWVFMHQFMIDRVQPSIYEVKVGVPDGSECDVEQIYGGCYKCFDSCETCDDQSEGPVHGQLSTACSNDYCAAKGGRVCTSAEWEKAAVGGCSRLGCGEVDLECCATSTRPYAWGFSSPSCELRASCSCTFPDGIEICSAYGYSAWGVESGMMEADRSPYGVYDLGGNGEEVVAPLSYEAWAILDAPCGNYKSFDGTNVVLSDCMAKYPAPKSSLYVAGRHDWVASKRYYDETFWASYLPNGPRCCYDVPFTSSQEPPP
jgi:hypothetical protein